MHKIYGFILGFLWFGLIPISIYAQSTEKERLLKEANRFFKERQYADALDVYLEAGILDKSDYEIAFQTAICHLKSFDKSEALKYLVKIQQAKPDFSPLLTYFLGEAYKYNNLPDESIRNYVLCKEIFEKENQDKKITLVNDELSVKEFIILLDQRLQEARTGMRFLSDPTNTKVVNLGEIINSEYSDYAPVISADESVLIFTSRRKGTTGGLEDLTDGQYYEDIYISQKKKDTWEKPKNLPKGINTKYHEASIALSPNGKQLFIYKDDNGGDIYVADAEGKRNWSEPYKMGGGINTSYHETSISITNDGNTVYFASDRPGGYGGLDIYRCDKKENGNWGEPQNLGGTINTAEDDDAPFIHFDSKTLYFSSKGHQNLGGYDIFYSENLNDQWTKPTNLGFPINTAQDDIHFVLSANYKRGYYATVQKEGFGDKDIYVINMPDYKDVEEIDLQLSIKTVSVGFNPLITNDPQKAIVIIRGVVKDELSEELISAKMSLIDISENMVVDEIKTASPKGIYYTTMNTGKKYLIHVQKEGYLFHSEYFEIPVGVVNSEKVLNIYLKRITVAKTVDFKALYDYNSATLKTISYPALDNLFSFLITNLDIKGEIAGHTDNIGTEKRNKELSEQRAKSVYDYLVKKGIDKERLTYVGFGPTQPISGNDTAFGRSLNRRTEFKILKVNNLNTP